MGVCFKFCIMMNSPWCLMYIIITDHFLQAVLGSFWSTGIVWSNVSCIDKSARSVSAILSPLQSSPYTPYLYVCVQTDQGCHQWIDGSRCLTRPCRFSTWLKEDKHTQTQANSWNASQGHCVQLGVSREISCLVLKVTGERHFILKM